MGHGRPALDFSHRHDVDAILLVANRKADEVTPFRDYALAGPAVPACLVADAESLLTGRKFLVRYFKREAEQRMGLKLSYRMNYISLFNLDSVAF